MQAAIVIIGQQLVMGGAEADLPLFHQAGVLAFFDGEKVTYLAGRQTQWHVVR